MAPRRDPPPHYSRINGNLVNFDGTHPKNCCFNDNEHAPDSNYLVVLTKQSQDLSQDEMDELEQHKCHVQEFLDDGVYLCRYEPTDITPIRQLSYVKKAGVLPKGLKITGSLQSLTAAEPRAKRDIYLILHEGQTEQAKRLIPRLSELSGVPEKDIIIEDGKVRLNGVPEAAVLDKLKAVDSVKVIEEVPKKGLFNDIASRIMGADRIRLPDAGAAAGSGSAADTLYKGAGQTVCVADTGLDTGDPANIHPAFQGRVTAILPISRPHNAANPTASRDDPDGHGTHVAGSVLGAALPDVDPRTHPSGIASEAHLVVQSMVVPPSPFNPRGGLNTGPIRTLLEVPYNQYNARIHTNSWGEIWSGRQKEYGQGETYELDKIISEKPDYLVLFAAGNDGDATVMASVGSHASAKNVLTVGATETSRPTRDAAVEHQRMAVGARNDPTEITFYSNRGPTLDSRIKPDVVAPGSGILSARSSRMNPAHADSPDDNDLYRYESGTSMATPLVAGCAAVLRGVLAANGVENPPAALMKALIINGAFAMHHAHSAKEGFGRVNLANSILLPVGVTETHGVIYNRKLIDKGNRDEYTINIPAPEAASMDIDPPAAAGGDDANRPVDQLTVHPPPPGRGSTLKVTLVYTDLPGARLQNNLNLVVMTADGGRRHGNMGTQTRDQDGVLKYDGWNNVEQVVWKGVGTGTVVVRVQASRVMTRPRGAGVEYALVWRIIPNEE